MGIRFLPILFSFLLITTSAKPQSADGIDAIARNFGSADAARLAVYFSSAVELNILGNESLYSKAQAEQILRDFFSKNKPVSAKIVHRLTSNANFKLAVLSMITAQEKFRVSISLSSNGERFLVKEIRIEQDKQ